MSEPNRDAHPAREPVLSPVDRVSELLFGLFMVLTFTGTLSVVGTTSSAGNSWNVTRR